MRVLSRQRGKRYDRGATEVQARGERQVVRGQCAQYARMRQADATVGRRVPMRQFARRPSRGTRTEVPCAPGREARAGDRMLNVFTLASGRLFQEEIDTRDALRRVQPVWVDL